MIGVDGYGPALAFLTDPLVVFDAVLLQPHLLERTCVSDLTFSANGLATSGPW